MKRYILLIGFALLCMSGYSRGSTLVKGKGYLSFCIYEHRQSERTLYTNKRKYCSGRKNSKGQHW